LCCYKFNERLNERPNLRLLIHKMNPSISTKVINNGKKVMRSIGRLLRERTPNVNMNEIKRSFGIIIADGKIKLFLFCHRANVTDFIGINRNERYKFVQHAYSRIRHMT
jgi:hypothetical protein